MRILFLLFVLVFTNVAYMFGQTESEQFLYEKDHEYFSISLKGKMQLDTLLRKSDVRLEGHGVAWFVNARVKPFQELIDEGAFSKERMRELEKVNDPLGIYVFFNETGIISDVYFSMPVVKRSLLTDKELYCIYQKYLGKVYDLTNVVAWDDNPLTPKKRKTFLSFDFFNIPFKDLKY